MSDGLNFRPLPRLRAEARACVWLAIALGGAALAASHPAARPIESLPLRPRVETAATARPGVRPAALPAVQDEVTLTMANAAAHPRVGVQDFLATPNDPGLAAAATTLADVMWSDLDFEREYYLIARAAAAGASAAVEPAAVPLDRWADLGADYVLQGVVRRKGDEMEIDLSLINVKGDARGRHRFDRQYQKCRIDNPRQCAHVMSDDLHKRDRALDGVAQTRIAFASDRNLVRTTRRGAPPPRGGKDIYIADYDGANQQRVTANGSINGFPAWSPTPGLLSFVSWVSGFPDIYVANLSQPGRLTRPAAGSVGVSNYAPAWSPDGSKLAFASNRTGNLDIWVVNRDGSGLQNLTNNPSMDNNPTWSPSGAQIAFTSDRQGANQLYMMSASGTGVQLLVGLKVDRPTWSSQNFIAFTMGPANGPYDIGIYDFANPGARQLTDGGGSNESPAVAPNGRHIAFFTTRWGGKQQIATIDRAGRYVRRVTEAGNNTLPNWQPMVASR